MTAEPPVEQTRFEKLSAIFGNQTHLNCMPDLQVRHLEGEEVEVWFGEQWKPMTMNQAASLWQSREVAIQNAQVDPFRYGHEPESWRDIDWLTLRKRVENPGIAVEILILGGQGCLDGETVLKYNVRDKDRKIQTEKFTTIKRLYERFNRIPRKGKGYALRKEVENSHFYVPSVDDENRVFMNRVVGVVSTGTKKCFRLTTKNGNEIVATTDHKFFTGTSFVPLSELTPGDTVHIHNNTRIKTGKRRPDGSRYMEISVHYHPMERWHTVGGGYRYCRVRRSRLMVEAKMNGMTYEQYLKTLNEWTQEQIKENIKVLHQDLHVHHLDENKRNDVLSNLCVMEGVEHNREHGKKNKSLKFVSVPDEVVSITPVGDRETFDIQCPFPNNNYIANGLVVHNSGKSFFGARCINRFGFYNPMCLLWAFSTDELNSKSVMQPAIYSYLPKELRTSTGKAKRTKNQKIIYTTAGGFTGNVMGYPNGTVLQFRFHSSELATLEGPRPHFVVTDENVPLTWVEAITDRLRSRADMSRKYMPEFEALWARKQANPGLRFPPEMVQKLYMGVHLIMFTPKFGYTATVHAFMKDARTLKEVPAELLKDNGNGPRMVPREMDCKLSRRAVFFMHPTDNPHAGNYSSFVAEKDTMTEETILWKVYGIASKKSHVLFPKFSSQVHVRKHEQILKAAKGGTWWMVTDPAAGRNMFCGWICVNPHNEILFVREWPQEDDYIPGYGYLGPWAIEGSKLDGAPGPAQNPLGMGTDVEASEFERVERALFKEETGGSDGRIDPYMRIIDSRSGNSPTMADSETRTLIQIFERLGLWFQPAGKESGALDGQTRVEESTKMVNSWLDYDVEKTSFDAVTGIPTFRGKAPRFYISERCTNTIFSLSTWTNADGQKGACKDPIDCLRYLCQADPFYVEPRIDSPDKSYGVY